MAATTVPSLKLNNGISIPQLGLGVWQESDDEAEFSVAEAIEAGYRLFDTAAMYRNEEGVGRAIKRSIVPREELFITTKLWNTDHGYEAAMKAFDESLSRLGLDYIDLYLIHWPTPARELYVETWQALEELYASGRVRAIGVSNFMPEHLDTLLKAAEVIPAVNQIEVHPDFQQHKLTRYCRSKGMAVESWSPLGGTGSGLLYDQIVHDIASLHNKTPAQVILRWHIQSGFIAIPKSVHVERIEENIDIFDFELSDVDMKELAILDGENRRGPSPYEMNYA